jgi:putative RNA ligase
MTRHPARTMPFPDLLVGLTAACEAGMVLRKDCPETGRAIYVYTAKCTYENAWNEFSVLARGLILHPESGAVVATPFPKFFNAGEGGRVAPDLPFEAFEKVDGSLAIIHWHTGRWRVATKGSFGSEQALWAERRLSVQDTSSLIPGATYLAEAVYPENRIVIRYTESELVLLGAYSNDGLELTADQLTTTAAALGWRTATRHAYDSFAALAADAHLLPGDKEGYVVRFSDGSRLKLKGAEYCRLHAVREGCTPLSIWEAMAAGADMEAMRKDVPEEFLADFDRIRGTLQGKVAAVIDGVADAVRILVEMPDRELGESFFMLPSDIAPYVWPLRKHGRLDGRSMQHLWRAVRPAANQLEMAA